MNQSESVRVLRWDKRKKHNDKSRSITTSIQVIQKGIRITVLDEQL